jgi:hypothetical protein
VSGISIRIERLNLFDTNLFYMLTAFHRKDSASHNSAQKKVVRKEGQGGSLCLDLWLYTLTLAQANLFFGSLTELLPHLDCRVGNEYSFHLTVSYDNRPAAIFSILS